MVFKGLTRNIVLLGAVSLLTDISSQMVFPLVPLFLTSVLGAGASIVGIVEGAAETTASILKVISGYWSDKIKKRKPFILMGYSLSTLTKPLFALATAWYFVLFVRVLERIGKGLRAAPRDALVAESSNDNIIGKAYGFQRSMDGIGSILGALFAFLLLPFLGYRNIFLLAFIPGILALVIIPLLRETKTEAKENKVKVSYEANFKKLSSNLRLFIIVSGIFSLGHFGYAFLLLKAKSIGLEDQSTLMLYVFFYIVYSIVSIPIGVLSDRVGRKPVLLIGYFLFGLICLSLVFIFSLNGMIVLFGFYGVCFALIDGSQRAFVSELSPKNLKGTALGTFHSTVGLVALPGGLVAGLLWDQINPEATFVYGFILSMLAITLFSFVKKANHQSV